MIVRGGESCLFTVKFYLPVLESSSIVLFDDVMIVCGIESGLSRVEFDLTV